MWTLSSSSDPNALAVVDGKGRFEPFGPHYSRRTPGSKTFTGVGQEIVLVSESFDAVWAVVYQRTPTRRGSGTSRRRTATHHETPHVWRNMLFRNLGNTLSSKLIIEAVAMTYTLWAQKYERLPIEVLRTEIAPSKIKSKNPGYCYKKAGFWNSRRVRGKIYLDAPCMTRVVLGVCDCCDSSWGPAETDAVKHILYPHP